RHLGPGGRRSPVFPEAGDQRGRNQAGGPQRPAPVDGRLQQSVPDTEVGAIRRATSDRPCEAGAPCQQNGQQPTGDNIECQAKTTAARTAPIRYSTKSPYGLRLRLKSTRRTLALYAKYSYPNKDASARSSGPIWKRLM